MNQIRHRRAGDADRPGHWPARAIAVALAVLCVSAAGAARAELYVCRDADGHTYRLRQTIELTLIDMRCEPVAEPRADGGGGAAMPDRFARPVSIVFPTSADDPLAATRTATFPMPAALASPLGFFKAGTPRAVRFASMAPLIRQVAQESGEDPKLLLAIASVESGFNPSAVSPKGAVGMMQLMPATARRFGWQGGTSTLFDPQVNVRVGARYIGYLKTLFPNALERVVAAYNAGEGAVMRFGGRIPPFAETQNYVVSVMRAYAEFARFE